MTRSTRTIQSNLRMMYRPMSSPFRAGPRGPAPVPADYRGREPHQKRRHSHPATALVRALELRLALLLGRVHCHLRVRGFARELVEVVRRDRRAEQVVVRGPQHRGPHHDLLRQLLVEVDPAIRALLAREGLAL